MKSKLVFLPVVSALIQLFACNNSDNTADKNQDTVIDQVTLSDGRYCALVTYNNPATGANSTYSLIVDCDDQKLLSIQWPQGGQLDTTHFEPVKFTSDSVAIVQMVKNKNYRVKIIGDEAYCSERFEGVLSRCNGTTKSGQRCKRLTDNKNGFCYQHQPK